MSDAPGMDPDAELRKLVARYKGWKVDFKKRLAATQVVMKQAGRAKAEVKHAAAADDGSGSGSVAATQRGPSLTARLLGRGSSRGSSLSLRG